MPAAPLGSGLFPFWDVSGETAYPILIGVVNMREYPKGGIIGKTAHPLRDHQMSLQALEEKGYCIEQTTRKYLNAYGLSDDIIRRAIKRNTVN